MCSRAGGEQRGLGALNVESKTPWISWAPARPPLFMGFIAKRRRHVRVNNAFLRCLLSTSSLQVLLARF